MARRNQAGQPGTTMAYMLESQKFYIWAISTAIAIFLAGSWFFYGVTIDDAYISARYAKNLLQGDGLTFNPGVRVEGYSNPSWVFLTSFLAWLLGAEALPLIGRACGVIATCLAMALIFTTSVRMGCSKLSAAIALLIFASLPQLSFWSVAGLETTLYGLLLLVSASLVSSSKNISALVAGAAALTRPEGGLVLLSNLFGSLDTSATWRTNIRRVLVYAAVFAAVVLPYFVFRLAYFEALTPNTYLVKAGGVAKFAQGIEYISTQLTGGGYVMLLLALASIFIAPNSITVRCLVLGLVGELGFVGWAGGDWMPLGRFLVPVFFLAAPLAAISLNWAIERVFQFNGKGKVALAGITFFCLLLFCQMRNFQQGYDKYYWRIAHGLDSRIAFGQWLRRAGPPDLLIAYGDMGALPFFSEKRFIDFHGLVDRQIASIRHAVGEPSRYHGLIDAEVLSRQPDLIVFVTEDGPEAPEHRMSEYGTNVLSAGLDRDYVFQGILTAYPPGFAQEYPRGRHLAIYARHGFSLPGLQEYLACSNTQLQSSALDACKWSANMSH